MTRARIVGILGASGGLGVSCLIAAMARGAQRRDLASACVDLRRFGGGLDVVFGVDHERAVRWPDLSRARGRLDTPALLPRLPMPSGVPLVSCDRSRPVRLRPEAIASVVDGLAEHVDLLVVDLPVLGSGELEACAPLLHEGLLVCGSTPQGLAAAGAHAHYLPELGVAWGMVQRLDAQASPEVAQLVASALGLPLIAVVPEDPRVAQDLRRGLVPGARGPLADAADEILDVLVEPLRRSA